MAANPTFIFDAKKSHYEVLNVQRNATSEDIKKAFREQALHIHPDKAGEGSTGPFQRLVEARDILLNKIKRVEYDDEHEDNTLVQAEGTLPYGCRLSETFHKYLKEWQTSFFSIPKLSLKQFPKRFEQMLQKFSNGFLKEQCVKANPMAIEHAETARPAEATTNLRFSSSSRIEQTVDLIVQASVNIGQDKTLSTVLSRIAQIYRRAMDCGYKSSDSSEAMDHAPIIDFSTASTNDIQSLLMILSADDQEAIKQMTSAQLLGRLLRYVPCKSKNYLTSTISTPSTTAASQCKQCKKAISRFFTPQYTCVQCLYKFCTSCPPNSKQIYGYGSRVQVYICNSCLTHVYQAHAKEWVQRAHSFIEKGSLQDLKGAFGCIKIALSLYEGISLTLTCKRLLQHNCPELALPLVLASWQQATKSIDKVKANKLLSSVLKCLACTYSVDENIRCELLLGAKEAALLAKNEVDSLYDEIPDATTLEIAEKEINQELQLSRQRTEDEQARLLSSLKREITSYWATKNLRAMVDFIQLSDNENEDDLRLQALEQFIQAAMKDFYPKMVPDDRFSLIFFQGILKLSRKRYLEGVADIEQVVWQSHSVDYLKHEAVNILLSLLSIHPTIFTLDGLQTICNQPQQLLSTKGIDNSFCERGLQLIALDEASITPPFSEHWPGLNVVGLNLRAHRKCEAAFVKQFKEKKWNSQDVGFAYIDYVQGCQHPAEIAVSVLHASMWFLKELKENDNMMLPQKFALKKLVLTMLGMAYTVVQRSLHPGMQLHVGRIALAVALSTLKKTEKIAMPEDTEIISTLLHMVTYNSRLVPFWNAPSVPVSEAALLSIISAELHTSYLDELTKTANKSYRPMTEAELWYQLYENDLRHIKQKEDPVNIQTTAMKELLAEKGWRMSDVSNLMSSPLSPRDEDGWLIQQSELGIQQEFAEVKGMVIDLDKLLEDPPLFYELTGWKNTSIQLVTIPADDQKGHIGTCSQTDFQHVLSILDEVTGTLFFSLEQPDNQKRFHPFQEFRYTSENLYKSDLLHTLFETDYLLKSFSVGTEVSAKPPFKQRKNKEGLTKNLPQHLQEKLKPISKRGITQNRAHRFWIQADKITYCIEQSRNRLEIRLGDIEMVVRSHPLIPGKDGKLIDTKENEDPESHEAKFAADMTQVYNELGLHFPMFSRLKELAKLQVLGLFLRGILQDMKEKSEDMDIIVSDELLQEVQSEALQNIRQQFRGNLNSVSEKIGSWPEAEDENRVSAYVNLVLQELPNSVHSNVELDVQSMLQMKDDTVLNQLVDALMNATSNSLPRYNISDHVRQWLRNRSPSNLNELVNYISSTAPLPTREMIKSQIIDLHRKRYTALSNLLEGLSLPKKPTLSSPCKWVPAALHKEEDGIHLSLCHGGVLIAPKIIQGQVAKFPTHSHSVSITQSYTTSSSGVGSHSWSSGDGAKTESPSDAKSQHPSNKRKPSTISLQPPIRTTSKQSITPGSHLKYGITTSPSDAKSQHSSNKRKPSATFSQPPVRTTSKQSMKPGSHLKYRYRITASPSDARSQHPSNKRKPSATSPQPPIRTTSIKLGSHLKCGITKSPSDAKSQHPSNKRKPPTTSSQPPIKKWEIFKKNASIKPGYYLKYGWKAFRVFGDNNSEGGDESKGGGHRAGNPRGILTAATAVALIAYGVDKLIETFGDPRMKTDTALSEVFKGEDRNPSCKRTNCAACARNIKASHTVKTASGDTYKTAGIPNTSSNSVYLIECIETGKIYIGMTTRQAVERIAEHLRDIAKGEDKTLPKHFNSLGCFGQFENRMKVTPLARVREKTMEKFNRKQKKRVMEYIETQFIDLFGRDQLLNQARPYTSSQAPDISLTGLYSKKGGKVIVDGEIVLERIESTQRPLTTLNWISSSTIDHPPSTVPPNPNQTPSM